MPHVKFEVDQLRFYSVLPLSISEDYDGQQKHLNSFVSQSAATSNHCHSPEKLCFGTLRLDKFVFPSKEGLCDSEMRRAFLNLEFVIARELHKEMNAP